MLFGKLWGDDPSGVAVAAKLFVPVWFAIALTNMWVGVTRAGYTVAQELPILLVVFAVPAIVSAVTVWQLAETASPHLRPHQQDRTIVSVTLPPALQSVVNGINAGDEDAIGAQARISVLEAGTTADTTHIVFNWQSRVFNDRSEAYVTVQDGLITEFRIPTK
ncbi:hypothetical protein [Brucella pituitosa]|uniref:hypothetical protein n=1 Tax=Brucella pituitosa TaxID=571256 RepID=UPI003F4AAE16